MNLETLDKNWDLVIVGGGITGAGILREAVRNGFKTLLVEQKDFAWGTSSRSSKLVHGGLRYLKEGNFRLTHESVKERERLIREAPGLVEPLAFHLPIYKDRKPGKWTMKAGLVIYDLISGKWNHGYYKKDVFSKMEPLVDTRGLIGGFSFTDAQVDDARLVLRLINESERYGGLALNYTRAVSLVRDGNSHIQGLVLEDTESKESIRIKTRLVINATGVWAEQLHPSPEKNKHLRPLRGSHLVFPMELIPIGNTVSFFSPMDGRPLFVIPWEGAVIVGTTDLDHEKPLSCEPAATKAEVAYLIHGINRIFPSLKITALQAISSFAGVRPVVSEGKVAADKESRDHVIWKQNGLVTVTGGKLTTFRALAHDTLRSVLEYLPGKHLRDSHEAIFDAVDPGLAPPALSRERFRVLWGRYGKETKSLLEKASPEDLERIPGTRTLWAELPHAAFNEKIRHLDDLLLRRVRLGLLLHEGGKASMDRIKALCAPVMNWDDQKWEKEIADYDNLWKACYSPCCDG
ncbi:MAG: glycerol-3-phosphate dehydrogenase/oxidase [Pseudomonadota bacterium]